MNRQVDKEQNAPMSRLIKCNEAAKYLAICERTLWELVKEGKIASIKIGRTVRFAVEDLDSFIQHCKGSGNQEVTTRPKFRCMDCLYWVELITRA